MAEKSKYEDLFYKRENAWKKLDEKGMQETTAFCEEYKKFLDLSKTEREFTENTIELLEHFGFISLKNAFESGQKIHPGDKVYFIGGKKSVIISIIGKESILNGINMVGTHIDSPRLDLKPMPLYEEMELAYLKTHYYGGVRKYQWLSIPLALHGSVILKDGSEVKINIGEKQDEPVFIIPDLLPHLAKEQNSKKLGEAFPGESLNILTGSIPFEAEDIKQTVKLTVLDYLNSNYGITEKDFINAEIQVVPAMKAKDIGFDRSMIGSYAHDDRICSYAALRAILSAGMCERTTLCYLADKEEIGSVGNTGAQSDMLEYYSGMLLELTEDKSSDVLLKQVFYNSTMLSGDVNAAYDPAFKNVYEKNNTMFLGKGVGIAKYTGARGKSGASDASAELMHRITNMLDEAGIIWQVGELGKIDEGGGGTIAK
ncbi:MAG: aminopeptidase, partial [Clostridia bacterium]|nr:aminopeptidase [Clostridia bacterium]